MRKETDNNKVYNKIIKIYDSSVKSLDELTINIIEYYYHRYKYIEIELKNHIEKKPPKLLKKRLKKWNEKKLKLENEKKYLLKKIREEITELKK